MDNNWRYIITPPARGAWNMAVDEALLGTVGKKECPPTIRFYSWEPACLSLGYAQSYKDIDLPRLQQNGWEFVRRMTGGRAILHVDELTYSITAPPDNVHVQGNILESYQRLAAALINGARNLGLPVEMQNHTEGAGIFNGPVCFEVPSAYEIVVGGKKLIGSAQARKKLGVLQHGSFPLYGDLTRITQALVFEDEAARQAAASKLLSRATTAETAGAKGVTLDMAVPVFVKAFEDTLGVRLEQGELTAAEKSRAEELLLSKYDHPSWNERG